MKRTVFVNLLLVLSLVLPLAGRVPVAAQEPKALEPGAKAPLSFVPNAGQTDPAVRFQVHSGNTTFFFAPDEVVLSLPATGPTSDSQVLRLRFAGANPATRVSGMEQRAGVANYYIGDDPERWRSGLPTYGAIAYQQLYPGIDLRYDGAHGVLKSTYTVASGADPALIRWQYEGASGVRVNEASGDLIIETATNLSLIERAPIAWQTIDGRQVPVSIRYALLNTGDPVRSPTIGFALGAYDPDQELTIDPSLVVSTYLGGNGNDEGKSIVVDNTGNIYVAGFTNSTNFPQAQGGLGGLSDAFVVKMADDGSLVYATYLGGSSGPTGGDWAEGIAVDSSGNAYVTGVTTSSNFPTPGTPYQSSLGGGWLDQDAFISKLDNTGAIAYSTYLGGTGSDAGLDIAVMDSGCAYVTGYTASNDFPLSVPAQSTYGGSNAVFGYGDAFVTGLCISQSSGSLYYSTYLGGSGDDAGEGIAVDPASGDLYVTGLTLSPNLPTTLTAYQSTLKGFSDAFVTKILAFDLSFGYSTYLGGSLEEMGHGIALDSAGNAYVTGSTGSTDYPTKNAYQTDQGGGDAFVSRLDPSKSGAASLVYSTYLGGSGEDSGHGVAVDGDGKAYVTGSTDSSSGFPLKNAIQDTYGGGGGDAFVAGLDPSQGGAASLLYSSYLGGTAQDMGLDIAVEPSGETSYLTGWTTSTDFPSKNPRQAAHGDGGSYKDAFVTKVANRSANLRLLKYVEPEIAVAQGGSLKYELHIRNRGPEKATVVSVVDTLPTGVSFVSVTPSPACFPDGPKVKCNFAELAMDAEVNVVITAQAPTQKGIITNTAEVTAWEHDPDISDNAASVKVTVGGANLSVTKRSTPNPVAPGANLRYDIVVSNAGPETAKSPTVIDQLPAGVTFVSVSPSPACYLDGQRVKCTLSDLSVQAVATVMISVTAPTQTGPITNTVLVHPSDPSDPDESDNLAAESTYVGGADLEATIDDTPDPVAMGAGLTYMVWVKNKGPELATNARFTATLPAGVTYVESVRWPGDTEPLNCGQANGIVTCNLGSIVVGGPEAFMIKVTAPSQEGAITCRAIASAKEVDPNEFNNEVSQETTVGPGADLAVTLSDKHDPVAPGTDLTYHVEFTNKGPEVATEVRLTNTLPAGVSIVEIPPSCMHSSGKILCSMGTLEKDASVSIQFDLKAPSQEGTIENTILVGGKEPDPNGTNNTAVEKTEVKPGTDLDLVVRDLPDPAAVGGDLTYAVGIKNNGPEVATKIRFTDTLPAGVTFVEFLMQPVDPLFVCSHKDGVITCSATSLPVGSGDAFYIRTKAPALVGKISSLAELRADEPDLDWANNQVTVETTVVPGADLAVAKSDLHDPAATGGDLEYQLHVTNLGPDVANSVSLTDTLPAGVTFVSVSTGCSHDSGKVTCALGTLAKNENKSINVKLKAPSQQGSIANTVIAAAKEPDPRKTNNTATEATMVQPGADLELLKTDAVDPVIAGTEFEYTLRVTNVGPEQAEMVILQDTLPAGVTFVSATPAPLSAASPLIWELGNLANLASAAVTVRVKAPAQAGVISNRANVVTSTPDPDYADNVAVEQTTIVAGADIDSDGISDQAENGAPNNGDGNGDGTPDSQQGHVASIPNGAGEYGTLVSPPGTLLQDVHPSQNPAPGTSPPNTTYPMDFYGFKITGLVPGASVVVTLTLHPGHPVNTYWKYGPTLANPLPTWYRFAYDGSTGVKIPNNHTAYIHFIDGQRGDDDLLANGIVEDPGAVAYQVFKVDSLADSGDALLGDAVPLDAAGDCTLRAVIEEANASLGIDRIEFDIGGGGLQTIQLNSPLPPIDEAVVIDGMSQPGYVASPVIELDGSWAGANADGLLISGGRSTIRGLAIHSFGGSGITLSGGGNRLEGNFVGTDSGGWARANGRYGLYIDNSPGNVVGGSDPLAGNLVSGNSLGGIWIAGPGASGNLVLGNKIGTDAGGYGTEPNYGPGVGIEDAADNTIGGAAPGEGNQLAGNMTGVLISGTLATGNQVLGNLIGTDALGASGLGIYQDGVLIEGAANNTIGGTSEAAANIIADCNEYGVRIRGAGSGNQVLGNRIGTDVSGSLDLGNWMGGVFVDGAPGNSIGGTAAGAGNLISANGPAFATQVHGVVVSGAGATGNGVQGNRIGTDASGSFDLGNSGKGILVSGAAGTVIGGNLISGNDGDGIEISGAGATGSQVWGNWIGLDAGGSGALPNQVPWDAFSMEAGVRIDGAPANTIGGASPAERNVIAGADYGLIIANVLAAGNVVQGNLIGTDAGGSASSELLSNVTGLILANAPNNLIGGTAGTTPGGACSGACNLISANQVNVQISGSGATGNLLQGNLIGTGISGSSGLYATPQQVENQMGVYISDAPGNTIGGTTDAARNLISANSYGVYVGGSNATGNLIQGNYIGTDSAGVAGLGGQSGVVVDGAANNTIGGTATGAGNLISDHGDGVVLMEIGATGNVVQGNLIGTDASGSAGLGNAFDGVVVRLQASNNLIGGTDSGAGNLIAYNGGAGISVVEGSGNNLDPNHIFANVGLGIDLGGDGMTPNDPGDGDSGANQLQNYPVITAVDAAADSTTVTGTLNSTANSTFLVEFFANTACDASGHGEGEHFVGSMMVTTDGNGDASFVAAFGAALPAGAPYLAATATGPDGSTSEFSECSVDAPTVVGVTYFTATLTADNDAILLQWETGSEIGSLGFRLYRSASPEGTGQPLNGDLIPSQEHGSPLGAVYSWLDQDLEPGVVYAYRLESMDIYGAGTMYGPVLGSRPAVSGYRAFLPMVHRAP